MTNQFKDEKCTEKSRKIYARPTKRDIASKQISRYKSLK